MFGKKQSSFEKYKKTKFFEIYSRDLVLQTNKISILINLLCCFVPIIDQSKKFFFCNKKDD